MIQHRYKVNESNVAPVSVLRVLELLADRKSIDLLDFIAAKIINTKDVSGKNKMSKKEYYSRIWKLRKAGILWRKSGKYVPTSFGILIINAQKKIRKALKMDWKLKVIDCIDFSNNFTADERNNMLDSLIADSDIKEILMPRGA